MKEKLIQLKLPIERIRKMNRQEYKAADQFLRFSARCLEAKMDWDKLHKYFMDSLLYGHSKICSEDLIKK